MTRRQLPLALALLGLGLTPGSGRANITFTMDPVTTTVNVRDLTETGDLTAVGRANASGEIVINLETDTALNTPASGQARVAAASDSALFTTVDLTPTAGMGFSVLELNPQILRPRGTTGTFMLTALDQLGNAFTSPVFALTNGENRVAAVATDGQLITRLTLTANAAIVGDVRQFRLTSEAIPATPIPEPASLATAGLGVLMGLGYAWRRRRAA